MILRHAMRLYATVDPGVRTRSPDPGELRRLSGLCSDWDGLIKSALKRGVAPLVFWELNRACPDAVPPEALSSLEECFRRNLKRNVILASELLHLLGLFHQAGIQVIPFKGPTLAWLAYETPGLRRVTDLDLLLPERDAGRAIELLLASGYRRWLQSGDLRFFATSGQVPLIRTDGLVAVDLHWLLGFRRLNFSYFHDRLRPVDIDRTTSRHILPGRSAHVPMRAWRQARLVLTDMDLRRCAADRRFFA